MWPRQRQAEVSAPQTPTWPVVVTRPEREALAWVQALGAAGFDPLPLPLMGFGPPTDLAALARGRQAVVHVGAVMFVSPQAVHAFFQGNLSKKSLLSLDNKGLFATINDSLESPSPWHTGAVRCWAPGPGTARALVQWGVPPDCIDQPPAQAPQFDSEALWPVVKAQAVAGFKLLLVRGETVGSPGGPTPAHAGCLPANTGTGRDWLVYQCEAAGAQVTYCVAYRRCAPTWSDQQASAARSALNRQAVWLLSSAESVGYLQQLMPGERWLPARALATHPRIAESARALGFGQVWQVRPALQDVLAFLKTLASENNPPRMPDACGPLPEQQRLRPP